MEGFSRQESIRPAPAWACMGVALPARRRTFSILNTSVPMSMASPAATATRTARMIACRVVGQGGYLVGTWMADQSLLSRMPWPCLVRPQKGGIKSPVQWGPLG